MEIADPFSLLVDKDGDLRPMLVDKDGDPMDNILVVNVLLRKLLPILPTM